MGLVSIHHHHFLYVCTHSGIHAFYHLFQYLPKHMKKQELNNVDTNNNIPKKVVGPDE